MVERIRDVHELAGFVPQGIFNRVVEQGGIPEKGPGSFSIPNALRKAEQAGRKAGSPQTLEQRRQWNRSNQLRPVRR